MRKIGAINPRDQTVLLQPLLCEKETTPAKPPSARLSRLNRYWLPPKRRRRDRGFGWSMRFADMP